MLLNPKSINTGKTLNVSAINGDYIQKQDFTIYRQIRITITLRYFDKLAFKAMNQGILHKGIEFYCNCDSSKVQGYTIDFGEKIIRYSHNRGKLFKKDLYDCKPKYLKSSEIEMLNEYIKKFYIQKKTIKINQDKQYAVNDIVSLAVKITFKGSPVSDMNHYFADENTDVNKTIYTEEFVEFIDYIKYLFSKYQ